MNTKNRDRARSLRASMTDAERALWQGIRQRQLHSYKFRRQHLVGGFIADFACLEKHLVIEVDGGQHAEQIVADTTRTKKLEALGYRVIRFWNNEVLSNMSGVLEEIERHLLSTKNLA